MCYNSIINKVMKWGITMKKYISLLLTAVIALGAVLPAAGCSSDSGSSDSVSSSPSEAESETKSAVTTAETTQTTTATTTTTTTTTLMAPMKEPVEVIDGFKGPGYVYKLHKGPGNSFFVDVSDGNKSICTVFDIVSQSEIVSLETTDFNSDILGAFSDGTIVSYSSDGGKKFTFTPKDGTESEAFKLDDNSFSSLELDAEKECVYWCPLNEGRIMKMDRKGNVSEIFADQGLYHISSIDMESRTFYAEEADERSVSGLKSGIYSIDDGRRLSFSAQDNTEIFAFKDGCASVINNWNEDRGNSDMELYDVPDGKPKKTYRIGENCISTTDMTGHPDCKYTMMVQYDTDMDGGIKDICFVDPLNGKYSAAYELGAGEYSTAYGVEGFYMPEVKRWIVSVNYRVNGNDAYVLMMMDPELLKYDQPLKEVETVQNKYEPVQVGEGFKEVRKVADDIEKEFGIRILVGNEVKNAEYSSSYVFDSVEDNEFITPEDEINYLNEFREVLKMYPKGFFEHFKSSNGMGGLRVSFVDDLKTDSYKLFSAGGIAFNTGCWYNIVLHHSAFGMGSTSFHHEMLHSTEQLVSNKYPFDEEEWNKLNPPGFEYTRDFDAYTNDSGERMEILQYSSEMDKNAPYFVSSYSVVTPMEDRATLIENLFTWTCDDENQEVWTYHQYGTEYYNDYPHLKAKLDYLGNWIKQEFGYVYWEETLKNIAASGKQPW